MAVVIASSVGASMSAATGRPMAGHLVYAANQGAWWLLYLSGTQALSALYSTDFVTWTAPSGSPFALTNVHNSEGRSLTCLYRSIASTDVLHVNCWQNGPSGINYHSRFTLGSTWTNTNVEANINSCTESQVIASALAFDSTNKPWTLIGNGGSNKVLYGGPGGNVDAGTSWSPSFSSSIVINTFGDPVCSSTSLASIGSGNMIAIADNFSGVGTMTNLKASAWASGSWGSSADVFGSALTSTDANGWGAVGRTTSDIHAVALSNNSNTYSHARFNGSSWSAGDSVPNLAYGTTSGVYLATDGTFVWAFVFDTSKQLQFSKWTSGSGWAAWSALGSARTNTPAFVTGVAGNNNVALAWTEHNGSNYDIAGTTLLPVSTTTYSRRTICPRAGSRGAA